MTWTFTDDVDVFLDAAGASLAARPAENTLVLTITAALRRHGPHAFGEHPRSWAGGAVQRARSRAP